MLDDSCSDFFAMLEQGLPGEDASGPIAWLADEAQGFLAPIYATRYPNGEPRILVQLCDAILEDWDRDPSATRVAYLKLVRLAQAILAEGNSFPGTPEADETARWLKIVIDDIAVQVRRADKCQDS
jgi:hypothetical protein